MNNALKVDHLTIRSSGKLILDDISFSIEVGRVVGLLGPSGAGKTTLMRAILGLKKPFSGSARVLGLIAGSKELRRKVGYVTQSPSIYNDLSVNENVDYFAKLVGATREMAKRVLSDVHLKEQSGQLADSLSGGERTRLSLAVAMLAKPQILILDEPTVGLDPLLRAELWAQFLELASSGTTLLISSHVMDEASRCQEILLLRGGRLLATGTPKELMSQTDTGKIEDAFLKMVRSAR